MNPEQEAMDATDESMESQEEVVDDSNSSSDEGQATEETPRAASADEDKGQANAQKMDWEKSYKHLQKKLTKDSQRLKQYERDYNEKWKSQLEAYERLESALANNPRAFEALKQALQPQEDPELAEDKVYQKLKPELDEIKQMKSFVKELQQERVKAQAEQVISKAETDASTFFKETLGKDISNEQLGQVISWMAENRVYNGKTAVKELFFDDIISHKSQSALTQNHAKKSLGTTRTQAMNGNAAQKPDNYTSFKDAWLASREELGMDNSAFQ